MKPKLITEGELQRSLVHLRRSRALIDKAITALTRYQELSQYTPVRCSGDSRIGTPHLNATMKQVIS